MYACVSKLIVLLSCGKIWGLSGETRQAMADKIFINYRRDESGHVAGRLYESLAPKFGRNKLFMDVDNIPVGKDFEDYQAAELDRLAQTVIHSIAAGSRLEDEE